jgi:hypothetical protein
LYIERRQNLFAEHSVKFSADDQGQGCQIFLGTIHQREVKIYQITSKLPIAQKIYTMAVKYSTLSEYITTFFIPRSPKMYPNWDFWSEKKPSGNPDHGCEQLGKVLSFHTSESFGWESLLSFFSHY